MVMCGVFDIDVVNDGYVICAMNMFIYSIEVIDGLYGYVIGAMDMFDVWYWNYSSHEIKEDM